MAVTDDQLDELKGWAYELGLHGVLAEPSEGQVVRAALERAELEGLRTEDEFDAILTEEDMPAPEDHRDIAEAFARGNRVREAIWHMLDCATSADTLRDSSLVANDDIAAAIKVIEQHPTMTTVNDLTR